MVSLGGAYAGLFTNNETLGRTILRSGEFTGERLWHLPIEKGYLTPSSVADTYTVGPRWGGAMSAAEFLQKFVGNTAWAHLDIAGTANSEKGVPGAHGELNGATGWGVRMLTHLLESNYAEAAPAAKVVRTGKRGRPRRVA
jgi:leucyl aminopeptidase